MEECQIVLHMLEIFEAGSFLDFIKDSLQLSYLPSAHRTPKLGQSREKATSISFKLFLKS